MNGQNENELISENQPTQKELDLGFSQIEPITQEKNLLNQQILLGKK